MSADFADLTVGTRVKYEFAGLAGNGVVVALHPGLAFSVNVHSDRGRPAMAFRPQDLTILPAEDVPPSDDAGTVTEGRVEGSTPAAVNAVTPRPSVTIALTPEQAEATYLDLFAAAEAPAECDGCGHYVDLASGPECSACHEVHHQLDGRCGA